MEIVNKLIIAYMKKKLGIMSPSAMSNGYKYEYDYLLYCKRRSEYYRRKANENRFYRR